VGFRTQLLQILRGLEASKVFCLVDDDIFIGPVDMLDFARVDTTRQVASLRLGQCLRRSYVVNAEQPLPEFESDQEELGGVGKLRWRWSSGALEWGYPLSLDGHLFDRSEFTDMAELLAFHSPNSLEANLQRFQRVFRLREGVCYREPVIVNVPCNRVQTEYPNRHGDLDSQQLLAMWRQGLRIDHRSLQGLRPESTHQDLALRFLSRESTECQQKDWSGVR
jgi:hypothetical protein